jgi:hypothetical protein
MGRHSMTILIGDFLGMAMAADSRIATARSPQGPAANSGSGSAALTNLHITVVPGASVSGPIIGIAFLDGTVTIPAPSLQFHRHPGSSLPNYRLSFFRPV